MRNKLYGKILSVLLIMSVCFVFSGCSSTLAKPLKNSSKPAIVCTAFPQYDWVLNILGEKSEDFDVILLNSQGTDMHSFQPTAANMVAVANCDLFIYMGGYSETWVDATLKSAGNENALVLPLLEQVDKLEEAHVEGTLSAHLHESESEDEDEDADHHDHDHEHEDEELSYEELHEGHNHAPGEEVYDEHLWLSLRCSMQACESIFEMICQLDPDNSYIYEENLKNYTEQLHMLDMEYEETVQNASVSTLLFADRFPFLYMMTDYDLEYFAAFSGCSAETEASFETIVSLSEIAEEHDLPAIIVLEGSDHKLAETIIGNTAKSDTPILTLNSMQSVREKDIDAGTTYLSIMEENLQVLKQALN